jgi:ferric-dicitrate binding protein FerR (iron transport regulator)
LLEKFHAGKCTPEEIALLESWYEQVGEENPLQLSAEKTAQYRQQFLTIFRSRLPRQKTTLRYNRPLRWVAAASILLLAGLGYLWIQPGNHPAKQLAENKTFYIANETDHVKKVLLTDSSTVWLNVHATLSWTADFNERNRRVIFTGEGYFDVHHDATRPFIIDTRDLHIQVLGTTFNVEAYSREKTTRVSLVQGSVKVNVVQDSSIQTLLKPGYAASFSEYAATITVNEMETESIAAWKDGGFVVKDITLRDAVLRLCERNGYSVHWAATKDIGKTVSIAFTKESFEQSLGNLCYMSHKRYKIKDKQVTIY